MFSAVPAAPALVPSVAVTFRLPPARAQVSVDRRWPAVARRLAALRAQGRRSVRIVDVACGAGELLLRAARTARSLGFLAIEARGVDRDARLIARARRAAQTTADPAIGLTFEAGDPDQALQEEADFPADLILYRSTGEERLALLARQAGRATFRAADAELAA